MTAGVVQQLLSGRLTAEALGETQTILAAWVESGHRPAPEEVRQISALLGGAGEWITGWQACVEDLRARQAVEEFGFEFAGYTAAGESVAPAGDRSGRCC